MRKAVLIALVIALTAVGAVDARKRIKPQPGTYIGHVTKGHGTGNLQLIYARFTTGSSHKARRAVQLFNWTGNLRCRDGTKQDVSPVVTAPLRGNTFHGHAKNSGLNVSLDGSFTGKSSMKGVARASSNGGDCTTGPVHFRAKRSAG